jgi:hypothetical protein
MLNWVSEDGSVSPFKVHFYSESPCEGAMNNDLPGRPGHPAKCRVKKDYDGVYEYSILASDADAAKASRVRVDRPLTVHLYTHVDGCKPPCSSMAVAPPGLINPELVYIHCAEGTASTDPALAIVEVGQVLEWSQVGRESVKWEASGLEAICAEGPKIGTLNPDAKGNVITTCTVKATAPTGVTNYQVSLSSCPAGPAQLTVSPASR